MDVDDVVFLDVEADRTGRVIAVGAVREQEALRLDFALGMKPPAAEVAALVSFVRDSAIGGHNVLAFDLPLLAQAPLSWSPGTRAVLDTLVLSMLCDPTRASHALDKHGQLPGQVPDPVEDARGSRQLARVCLAALKNVVPEIMALYVALLEKAGQWGTAQRLAWLAGIEIDEPSAALASLPESFLSRLCRVQLGRLVESVRGGAPEDSLALALALRFVEVTERGGRLGAPPSAALAAVSRFSELLTRLLGPLCPDLACRYRERCEVHRPYAEEILAKNFELSSFRPRQREIVHAVLGGRQPLAVLPTTMSSQDRSRITCRRRAAPAATARRRVACCFTRRTISRPNST